MGRKMDDIKDCSNINEMKFNSVGYKVIHLDCGISAVRSDVGNDRRGKRLEAAVRCIRQGIFSRDGENINSTQDNIAVTFA